MVYMYHSFLIHSCADGHLGCFHVLAMIKQCCDEHWGARVSFSSGFLGVYAQNIRNKSKNKQMGPNET